MLIFQSHMKLVRLNSNLNGIIYIELFPVTKIVKYLFPLSIHDAWIQQQIHTEGKSA